MSLFKKKNKNNSPLFTFLDNEVMRAKERGNTCFYYLVYDKELADVNTWCSRNKVFMTVSHKTGDNLVYKFTF